MRALVVLFSLFIGPTALWGETALERLTFRYIGTPPYVFFEKGKMEGIFLRPAERVLAHAGFRADWIKVSQNRVARMLDEGSRPFCVVTQGDYYKKKDAERWHISTRIAEIDTRGLLVRFEQVEEISQVKSIQELIENNPYRGGFVGIRMESDQEVMNYKVDPQKHLLVNSSPFELSKLVAHGRVDFMLTSKSEADVYKSLYEDIEELVFIEIPGIYQKMLVINILCTKAVPAAVMERINQAIAATK